MEEEVPKCRWVIECLITYGVVESKRSIQRQVHVNVPIPILFQFKITRKAEKVFHELEFIIGKRSYMQSLSFKEGCVHVIDRYNHTNSFVETNNF